MGEDGSERGTQQEVVGSGAAEVSSNAAKEVRGVRLGDRVIIALGGNDGLRGHPLKEVAASRRALARKSREAAQVLLGSIVLPPNYGSQYTAAFARAYEIVAREVEVPLVPLFAGIGENMAGSQRKLLENVWPVLELLLRD